MPCYVKGQPMPNPRYCLFRQDHAGKAAKQKFFDKLRRKSKYYSLVLTKDLVLCVSDRSSNVIEFTVDLCKDEYVHEKGELEDKLHIRENGEELCFNTSTTPVLRDKICKSEFQSHHYSLLHYLVHMFQYVYCLCTLSIIQLASSQRPCQHCLIRRNLKVRCTVVKL